MPFVFSRKLHAHTPRIHSIFFFFFFVVCWINQLGCGVPNPRVSLRCILLPLSHRLHAHQLNIHLLSISRLFVRFLASAMPFFFVCCRQNVCATPIHISRMHHAYRWIHMFHAYFPLSIHALLLLIAIQTRTHARWRCRCTHSTKLYALGVLCCAGYVYKVLSIHTTIYTNGDCNGACNDDFQLR